MTSHCQTIQPLLSEFLDEQLDARTAWEVQTHIAGCAACARTQRDLSRLRDALHTLPMPALSAGFDAALAERLALTRRPAMPAAASWKDRLAALFAPPPPAGRLRPVLAFGAAGAAAALGLLLFLSAPTPPVSPVLSDAVQTVAVDHAFVAECLAQRRREAAGEPLADLSAQNLAGHLDTAPATDSPSTDPFNADTAAADAGMF